MPLARRAYQACKQRKAPCDPSILAIPVQRQIGEAENFHLLCQVLARARHSHSETSQIPRREMGPANALSPHMLLRMKAVRASVLSRFYVHRSFQETHPHVCRRGIMRPLKNLRSNNVIEPRTWPCSSACGRQEDCFTPVETATPRKRQCFANRQCMLHLPGMERVAFLCNVVDLIVDAVNDMSNGIVKWTDFHTSLERIKGERHRKWV